jgi:hypothetical protein
MGRISKLKGEIIAEANKRVLNEEISNPDFSNYKGKTINDIIYKKTNTGYEIIFTFEEGNGFTIETYKYPPTIK